MELHQIEQVDSQDMQAALPQYFKVSEKNFICKMRAVAREMLTGDAFRARACVLLLCMAILARREPKDETCVASDDGAPCGDAKASSDRDAQVVRGGMKALHLESAAGMNPDSSRIDRSRRPRSDGRKGFSIIGNSPIASCRSSTFAA